MLLQQIEEKKSVVKVNVQIEDLIDIFNRTQHVYFRVKQWENKNIYTTTRKVGTLTRLFNYLNDYHAVIMFLRRVLILQIYFLKIYA